MIYLTCYYKMFKIKISIINPIIQLQQLSTHCISFTTFPQQQFYYSILNQILHKKFHLKY